MSKRKMALINVVGLSQHLIGDSTPFLSSLLRDGESVERSVKPLKGAFPAVTTTAQSAMLTGKYANEHGVVGNGWYFPELAEILFWRQPNQIVQAEKIWEALRKSDPGFTCANSFWWYNMYSSVDFSLTPRPHYPADGRKIPDLYSFPCEYHKRIEARIGKFPFFNFWGPKAGIESSEWIAKAAIEIQKEQQPNLHLIYLPHLDYNLQRLGPDDPQIRGDLLKIDGVLERLCNELQQLDTEFLIVSEYGINKVDTPIHINRILRRAGLLKVRESLGFEVLDCGASQAFAAADHQVAHIYLNDKSQLAEVKALLEAENGIEKVMTEKEQALYHVNHERAGDLVAVAEPHAWFTYYYWLEDAKAPDFATTVDIHRKPGYDPVEMFLDPDNPFIFLKVMGKLLLKKLGFRSLFNVVPLRPDLIKGSHGRCDDDQRYWPVVIGPTSSLSDCQELKDVYTLVKRYFEK